MLNRSCLVTTMERHDARGQRILVSAPIGRDGPALAHLLNQSGLAAVVCPSADRLPACIDENVLAVCLTEEALFGAVLAEVEQWILRQPAWSDLPFVVLTGQRENPTVLSWRERMVAVLGNVTLLERPVQGLTLTTTVQAAVRARVRQYQIRAMLDDKENAAAVLERTVESRTRALERANEDLVREIAERTQIEETLRQAQKMEALGQLTGGVAHDFNNLLMVISSGLQILVRRDDAAGRERLVKTMQQAVDRGAGLTRQLLAFSRRQALHAEPLDLAQQVRGMREILERSLRGDIHVSMSLPDTLWVVEVDPGELELVIINLAVNARDAMPNGGSIHIEASNVEAGNAPVLEQGDLQGDFVMLSITDSGTGMTPDVKARVFEPFFTTKEVGKGSGLGLAQAYGFARQSGGTVQIVTELGKGTSVRLMLPRSEKAIAPTAKDQPAMQEHGPEAAIRVLLVEDDDEVAALTAEMLAGLGYEVTRVGSPAAALGALANGRTIDLVFSDIMMPGDMNGIELAGEIRSRRKGLPVILTTGYVGEAAKRAQAAGIPLLPKPYRVEELAMLLKEAVSKTRPAQRP